MYYIQETDKPNPITKLFNIVQVKGDKLILPIGQEEIKTKKAERLAQKTIKILEKTNSKKVVLSKQISKQEEYTNFLHSYGAKIIEGKWLFKALTLKVLDYIVEKKRLKKEELQISMLINEIEPNMLENIKEIVKQYKRINIVTNHFEKFKKIEQQIFDEYGIMITVTNNKKKSLSKSQLILNVDFPKELINKYRIFEEAIIVNLCGNVAISSKRFNGVNIIDYEIDYTSDEEFDFDKNNLYDKKKIYEAHTYTNRTFDYLQKQFLNDKVKIRHLQASNSIL